MPNTLKTSIHHDESISSWLIRAALDCGTDPLTFASFYWGQYRLWTLDLDRGFEKIDPQIYRDITILAFQENMVISQHSLYQKLYAINEDSTLKKGTGKWIIPRSSRNRSHKTGQQYCVYCLADDGSSYLRYYWRFAFHFGCLTHQVLFNDKCSNCGTLYQPHLLSPNEYNLNYCHFCNTPLHEKYLPVLINNEQIITLAILNDVFHQKSGKFLSTILDSKVWFDVLRYFINLLRYAINSSIHCLAVFVRMLGVSIDEVMQPKTGLAFELLPINERINLLKHACNIMALSEHKLIQAVKNSGITQKYLQFEAYPEVLSSIFNKAPAGETKIARAKRSCQSKNNSPTSVSRRWERLKRQFNI